MKHVLLVIGSLFLLLGASYAGVIYYDDPIAVGIGARPIGMGSAYVALADDTNAIFLNPAGLATQKQWGVSTMSTNFMEDYRYSMISAVFPTASGTYGLGFVNSGIGGIIVDPSQGGGTTDFYNQAVVLSYARDVSQNLSPILGSTREIYAGANLKYFSKGYTGDLVAGGVGFNFDIGLKYVQNDWLSYGLMCQNVLFGGQVSGDFDPEVIPFTVTGGFMFTWKEMNLKFLMDKDLFIGRDIPWPLHFGMEWTPQKNIFLSSGVDQVAGTSGSGNISTNPTFGVGLNYEGMRAELSYEQNFSDTQISSTYFSLSYYGDFLAASGTYSAAVVTQEFVNAKTQPTVTAVKPQPAPAASAVGKFELYTPDKLATYNNTQVFTGGVADYVAGDVYVGDVKADLASDRTFKAEVPLKVGENDFSVSIVSASSRQVVATRKVLRYFLPTDMPQSMAEILRPDQKMAYTILQKYLGKDYSMDKKVSRELLALILVKSMKLNGIGTRSEIAKDVDKEYWAYQYISSMLSYNLMSNYSDGYFRPDKLMTKYELVRFLSKATGKSEDTLQGVLSGRPMDQAATMQDIVDIALTTSLFSNDMSEYNNFQGMNGEGGSAI